jgi:predicted nucleotidyltransferase
MSHPFEDEVAGLARGVAGELSAIPGIVAVVLGGSWSRGDGDSASDLDLGVYYRASNPPALEALRRTAAELDTSGSPPVATDFGEWGEWVNGGAWLTIGDRRVDWLYRELERVSSTIDRCAAGHPTCHYYLGHPHGFHNHIYLAEVHHCRPLFDPHGVLEELKQRVRTYPPRLKEALIRKFGYDARFMLELARKPAQRGDVFHVSGCLFRCAAALIQVLFARNEEYFMNEKGSLAATDRFSRRPRDFSARVSALLSHPGESPGSLARSLDAMAALLEETSATGPESSGEPRRADRGARGGS